MYTPTVRAVLLSSTAWAATALAVGCENTSNSGHVPVMDASLDSAADSSADGSSEAAPEASSDVAHEASNEAAVDGSKQPDANADGAPDASSEAAADSGVPPTVVAEPGYSVTLWARGTADYFNPDSIDYDGVNYWVGFQNKTTKDGSDGGTGFGTTSTVVEYASDGSVVAKYTTPGHCDGLRFDPVGHKVWATSNEDGNPHLVSIDPAAADASAAVVEYSIVQAADAAAAAHGGGYDDLRFLNGAMFVVASAPSVPGSHIQAIDSVTITGTTATFSPVVFSDSMAVPVGGDAPAPLALSDPDSLAIDDQGRLALVGQDDKQLIFISNPGAASQSLSVLSVATQPEDPVWITKASGRLLLVDSTANAIYEIHTTLTVGTVFTETANNATIPGIFATVDLTTGAMMPKIVGFGSPTGLIFVPSP
jgi:hypothetical protein